MEWLISIAVILGVVGGMNLYSEAEVDRTEMAFPDSGRYIEVYNCQQHYFEAGMSNDTPLVLLHGVGATSYAWIQTAIMDSLATEYHVYAFDRAGHGYSDRPAGMGGDPRAQAEFLHAAISELGLEEFVMVGHSWGSAVAISYVIYYPGEITDLVLLSPYILPQNRAVDSIFPIATIPGLSDVLLNTLAVPFGKIARVPITKRTFSPEVIPDDYWSETILLSQRPKAVQVMAEDIIAIDAALEELSPRYGEISVPVSIMVGEFDVYFGDDPLEELSDSLGWQFEQLPGAGHGIQYTCTEQVVRFIRTTVDQSCVL